VTRRKPFLRSAAGCVGFGGVLRRNPFQGAVAAMQLTSRHLICRGQSVSRGKRLARHFNTPGLTANEIRSLGRYEICAQLTQVGAKLPAFWARTPSPPSPIPCCQRASSAVQSARLLNTLMTPREDIGVFGYDLTDLIPPGIMCLSCLFGAAHRHCRPSVLMIRRSPVL